MRYPYIRAFQYIAQYHLIRYGWWGQRRQRGLQYAYTPRLAITPLLDSVCAYVQMRRSPYLLLGSLSCIVCVYIGLKVMSISDLRY